MKRATAPTFVRIARIRLTDVDSNRDDPLDPTLREFAGFENGDEFTAEIYSDGSAWFEAGVYRAPDSEYGLVRPSDVLSASASEYEIIG